MDKDPDEPDPDVWFSVFPRKGTCEGSACDAVLEDLLDQKLVRGDVVKASKQHDVARGDGKVPSSSAPPQKKVRQQQAQGQA